jgi:hypothetical protein
MAQRLRYGIADRPNRYSGNPVSLKMRPLALSAGAFCCHQADTRRPASSGTGLGVPSAAPFCRLDQNFASTLHVFQEAYARFPTSLLDASVSH